MAVLVGLTCRPRSQASRLYRQLNIYAYTADSSEALGPSLRISPFSLLESVEKSSATTYHHRTLPDLGVMWEERNDFIG